MYPFRCARNFVPAVDQAREGREQLQNPRRQDQTKVHLRRWLQRAVEKADLRGKIHIVFINELGNVEDGQDAGGLFKEFLT